MGQKSRRQVRLQQEAKRKKKRDKLAKQGKNPDDFFMRGTWIGPRKEASS